MFLGMFALLGCLALFVVFGGIFFILMAFLRGRGWGGGYYRPYRRPWFFGGMPFLPFLFGERPFRRREGFYDHHHEHHHHGGFGGHHHHGGGFGGHHGGHH